MANLDDIWISSKSSETDAKTLHALGSISLIWNACEYGLLALFCAATNTGARLAWIIIHDLGDVSISNKIRDALILSKNSEDKKGAILYALELYDVNRLNRNQLTHFLPLVGLDGLALFRQKGPFIWPEWFPSDLKSVRRVADELAVLANYLSDVGNYFIAKMKGTAPEPLPERPPLPERLWKPRPQGQPKRQPPPESSQA